VAVAVGTTTEVVTLFEVFTASTDERPEPIGPNGWAEKWEDAEVGADEPTAESSATWWLQMVSRFRPSNLEKGEDINYVYYLFHNIF
jgi:hypothetical protein